MTEEDILYQADLFSKVNCAIIALDENFILTAWNPAAEKMYGWRKEEVIGRSGPEILKGELFGITQNDAQQKLAQSGELDAEVAHHTRDGDQILVDCKVVALRDNTGHVSGYVSVHRDITQQKQTEQQMRLLVDIGHQIPASEDLNSALGIALRQVCQLTKWDYGEAWVPNSVGNLLECCPCWYSVSEQHEELRQKSEQSSFTKGSGLIGRVWASQEYEWLDDITGVSEESFHATEMASKVGLRAALAVPIIDEETSLIAVLAFYMRESGPQEKQLIEVVSSVANQLSIVLQQKQAIAARRESELQFKNLIESSPDMIVVVQNHNIVYVNPAGLDLLKYSFTQLENRHLSKIFDAPYRPVIDKLVTETDELPPPLQETQLLRRDHELVDVEITFVKTLYKRAPALLGFGRDIREKKAFKRAAQRKERTHVLGEFSASIAHELRNPIGALKLNYKSLIKHVKTDDTSKSILRDIEENISRVETLMQDILAFARPAAPDLKPIDIHEVIDSSLDRVNSQHQESKIEVMKRYHADPSSVLVDPDQIAQALINLFMNAIEAMETGGKITITTSAQEKNVVVQIEDTGKGISKHNIDKVFEPFFTTKKHGTGLGLAIIARILEQNNSGIKLESDEGIGTKFIMSFPLAG